MGLSSHFDRWEFACNCGCGFDAVDVELLGALEKLRFFLNTKMYGVTIKITSGCRCATHNASKEVGGATKSYHLIAKAADFKAFYGPKHHREQCSPIVLAMHFDICFHNRYGLITYDTINHMDVRDNCYRSSKITQGAQDNGKEGKKV